MYSAVSVTLLVGLCVASPLARDRQTRADPPISNVCTTSSLAGPVNFPHPTDNTKFLQCAPGGRMFIIQCPTGETYNHATTSCTMPQPVTTAPVTTPTNPCTAGNVQMGNIFFAYPGDNTRFIECTGVNQPSVLTCPTRLVYDAGKQSCVFVPPTNPAVTAAPTVVAPATSGTGTGTGSTGTGTGGVVGTNTGTTGGNPCANAAVNVNNLFFPAPNPYQFFQCDLAGNAYLMNCPAGLVWNQAANQCGTAFGTVTSANTMIG